MTYDRFQIRGAAKRGEKNPFKLLILVLKLMNYVALITEMSFIKLQVFRKMNNLNLKKRLNDLCFDGYQISRQKSLLAVSYLCHL